MINELLPIVSTVFLTLGVVAFKSQQNLKSQIESYRMELEKTLESLSKLHNENVVELATIKKDLSDIMVSHNIKKAK